VWLAVRLLAVLVILAAAGWWFLLSPVTVTAHTISIGNVTAEVLGTGTLEARTSALVGPKMAGLISRVNVDQGDRVKAGETLIHLEDTDFKQQVAVAEADVAAAVAAIDRLHADQRRAEAVLVQARLTHERLAQSAAANASSQQELDKAAEAHAIADAELSRAGTANVEGQKRHAAAERTLDFQRARLDDTTIEAPFDALVLRREREAGDVVTAGSSVLLLASLAEIWVTAWVDETELAKLAEGQPARVVFRSEASMEYPGVVARLGREADRETREIVVDVHVKQLPANWAVGQRAEVYIRTDHRENVVSLPAALVLLQEGKPGVLVDEGGKARWRAITLGLRGREVVEVLSGLSVGDVVVSPKDPRSGSISIGRRISPR
jgi:HlyD family secretion protein